MSEYLYKDLDFPGSDEVLASSINDSGAVVGVYFGTISNGGFLYGSDGQYSTLPGPSVGQIDPEAINNLGNIAGYGFWIDNGTYKGLFVPGTSSGDTFPVALNNSNEIIGFYIDSSGRDGFSYLNGSYTTITVPGSTGYTSPTAINDSGEIVGYYTNAVANSYSGFILNDGSYVTIPTPEDVYRLVPEAVNASGEIAGFYENDDTSTNAFVYANDTLTTLSAPAGATDLEAIAINNVGDVAGTYIDSNGNTEGFVYHDGSFVTIADPAAVGGTTVVGFNNVDQVIGSYTGSDGSFHSFIASIACFQEGTRIATHRGDVAVELLAVGDLVLTVSGRYAPIRWIGHRHVNCRKHAQPRVVRPIEIAAHAFALNQPAQTLRLSPDHGVFVEGVFVPVKYVVNGANIRQLMVPDVTYFHVELDQHDVILAEGLPCESYLDTGQRNAFANDGDAIMLHPAFGPEPDSQLVWESRAYAPLVVTGPMLDHLRARLNLRAHERQFKRARMTRASDMRA